MSSLSLVAALTALVAANTASAQVKLQFKYDAGDKFGMTVAQDMKSTANVQGRDIETNMKQTMYMVAEVQSKNSDGTSTVHQKIARVQTKMDMPAAGQSFSYDSDSDDNTAPAAFSGIMDKLVGGNFAMNISPAGKVTDIELSEDFLSSLPADGAGFLSKDGLKQMMTQGAVAFPETPVKEGDTWSTDMDMKMPFGKMTIKQTNTYKGKNDDGLHLIDIALDMDLTPGEGQPFKMSMKDSSSKGTMLFDNRKGRMVKSEINQKMTIEMEIGGNTINQKVDQKIVVTTTDGSSGQ